MAARRVIDPCMFCNEVPCVCFAKPKKATAKRATKTDDKARMEERAKARKRVPLANEKPAPKVKPKPAVKKEAPPAEPKRRIEIDETRVAIRVLAEARMLHPAEREKHPTSFPSVQERIKAWKERVSATS